MSWAMGFQEGSWLGRPMYKASHTVAICHCHMQVSPNFSSALVAILTLWGGLGGAGLYLLAACCALPNALV